MSSTGVVSGRTRPNQPTGVRASVCLYVPVSVCACVSVCLSLCLCVSVDRPQLAAAKREAVANEEQLTTAFSGVMAGLEEEVSTLTAQRDDAVTKLEIAERKLAARRFGACSNLHAAPATRAADDAARRSDTGAPSAPSAPDGARQQPGGEAAHEPPTLRALNLRAAEEKGTPDGKAKSRLRAAAGGMRRALSFDRAGGKRGSKAPKDQPSPKSDGDAGRENALGRLAE
jgi:hypothetical protein